MLMMMLARRLQQLRTGSRLNVGAIPNLQIARGLAIKSDTEDWSDFNSVIKVKNEKSPILRRNVTTG